MSNYQAYASSRLENFGSVTFSSLRRRRGSKASTRIEKDTKRSSSSAFQCIDTGVKLKNENDGPLRYKYNKLTATLLVPSITFTYARHDTPIPFMVSLYAILVLYALDLCRAQVAVALGIWIAFGSIMISFVVEYSGRNDIDSWGSIGLFLDLLILFCSVSERIQKNG